MAQVIMAQWRAGNIIRGRDYLDSQQGRVFINIDSAHLPISDGDWVILTQENKSGVRIQKSSVPFARNYCVIKDQQDLLDKFEDLRPFVHRLFYARVDQDLVTPSVRGGYSRRVNGFENGGYYYLNSESPIPAGSVVEVLKGSKGGVIQVALVNMNSERVYRYPNWHAFMEAAQAEVQGIKPFEIKRVVGLLAFPVNHKGTRGKCMHAATVDVPGTDGRVADVFLIHKDDGPLLAGDAVEVWAENGKLFCHRTTSAVESVFGDAQDIVDALRPKLASREVLATPTGGAGLK